jgi:transcriptional regulator with XRE-family HTH domain
MSQVARNIQFIRDIRKYTQEYMSAKIGVSQKTYSNYENGKKDLSDDEIKKIAEALEVSPQALKTIDDKIVIHQITTNHAITTDKVTVNNNNGLPEDEKVLFERIIAEKDRTIADKDAEIAFLRRLLNPPKQ